MLHLMAVPGDLMLAVYAGLALALVTNLVLRRRRQRAQTLSAADVNVIRRATPMGPDTLIAQGDAQSPNNRFGLFVHHEDEAAYVTGEWTTLALRIRHFAFWGSLAFVLLSIVDWIMLHDTRAFTVALMLRLVALAFGLRTVWLSNHQATPQPKRLASALLAFESVMIIVFCLISLIYGHYSSNQIITGLLMTLAFYAYVPALRPAHLWLLPAAAFVYLLELSFVFHASSRTLISFVVLLGFTNLVGWRVATQSNRTQRLNWLDRRRLKREVTERIAAEQSLRHLFEVCPVPLMLSCERNGEILHFNHVAQSLLDPAGALQHPGGVLNADFYTDANTQTSIASSLRRHQVAGPMDVQIKTFNHVVIDVMLSARRLRYNGGNAILTSLVEITTRKRYERELLRLAQTDPLTGLHNRRGFFKFAQGLLDQEIKRPISILLLDADHFKRINDSHGHDTGDVVLQHLTGRISAQLREHDGLARIGGEEFAALLPNTNGREAKEIAERVRCAVAAHAVRYQGLRLQISLSIGVAELMSKEITIDAALSRADKAMYSAKQSGRNRVVCAGIEA